MKLVEMLAPIDGEPQRVIVHVYNEWFITWNRSITFQIWKLKGSEFVEENIRTSDTEVDGLKDACKRAQQWMAELAEVLAQIV